jgi:hypothetical protein
MNCPNCIEKQIELLRTDPRDTKKVNSLKDDIKRCFDNYDKCIEKYIKIFHAQM